MEQLFLVGTGTIGDDCRERIDPLAIGCGECADRPVATEDDAIGAELVHHVVNDRREVVGLPRAGAAEATMPETLRQHFCGSAIRPISAFQPERSFARTLALPQWSRINDVPGQASISLAASPSSAGRMHRSKLNPILPSRRMSSMKRFSRQCPAGVSPA